MTKKYMRKYWDKSKDEEIANRIFKLMREGYTVRIATNIVADEYNYNFSQMHGRFNNLYIVNHPNTYKEALEESSKERGNHTKTRFTEEMDNTVIRIFSAFKEKNKTTIEASIIVGKELNIYPVEAYERWNWRLKPKIPLEKKEVTMITHTEKSIKSLIELHQSKLIDDDQIIRSLYKIHFDYFLEK